MIALAKKALEKILQCVNLFKKLSKDKEDIKNTKIQFLDIKNYK